MHGSKRYLSCHTRPARLVEMLPSDAVMSMPGVHAGVTDTGALRDGAAPSQPYERSDGDDGDAEDDDGEEGVRLGGVSQVDAGRWAASISVKDTGCMLDVGTCVPPHRLWLIALHPNLRAPCQQAAHRVVTRNALHAACTQQRTHAHCVVARQAAQSSHAQQPTCAACTAYARDKMLSTI